LEQLLSKQLKLNGESAKNIMTTFAFPYVSYLLHGREPSDGPEPLASPEPFDCPESFDSPEPLVGPEPYVSP